LERELLMSEKSKVSVIIPCYNYAHFLEDAVGSVLDQTYNNWECLIIDDGSTDNTQEVASKLVEKDLRIKYFYQGNMGLTASRNRGFALSQGEYIQFLDADDMIHPRKLQEQVEILDHAQAIGVSYTNYQTFKDDLSILTGRYSHLTLGDHPLEDFLFKWERGLSIPIHAALFRRSVFEKHEKPFVEELRAKEDWVMWVQLASEGVSFHFLDKDYCYYRVHGFSNTKDYKKMYSSFMEAAFIISTIVPSCYHKKFVFSSLKHADITYLDIILNVKANATLFYDKGEKFHPGHALTQSIGMHNFFNFKISYDLSQIGCVNQLRFDPLEGHLIRAKLSEVKYKLKSGKTKELDLSTVTSNGLVLDNAYTLFQTFDPLFLFPINGELQNIQISGKIQVLENREIEKLLLEKDQLTKKMIQEKEQAIAEIEQTLEEKEQAIAGLEQGLAEKEQAIAGLEQGLAEKEQAVAGLEQGLAEKEQAVAGLEQGLAEKEQAIAKLERNLEDKEQVLHSAAEKIERLEHELSAQSYEIEQRIQEIEAILNSKSWRITAPLRIIASWVKEKLIAK
jgi:glycosyltransferase involved in cell wall biosynthesis